MTQRTWPTREEWTAKAEYSVRTFCTMYERLPDDAIFVTPEENAEATRLASILAASIRPLLNAEINRLKALVPDRPKAGRARIDWILNLEGKPWETASNLAALEEIRRDITRSAKTGAWGNIAWELCRIRKSYPAITLTEQLNTALDQINAIGDAAGERRRTEAQRLEDEAVARRIAYRATDEAWAKELQRRADIDAGPRITYHRTRGAAVTDTITTTVPFAEQQTISYDLPNGAPDINHGNDGLVPTRITLRYTQLATSAIPQNVEVTIKGLFRNPDGTVSKLGGTVEAWRYVAPGDRVAWIAVLVNENLPAWWTR